MHFLHIASNNMMAIANCNSGQKSISHVTGRCALFNVKLHFLNPYTALVHLTLKLKIWGQFDPESLVNSGFV